MSIFAIKGRGKSIASLPVNINISITFTGLQCKGSKHLVLTLIVNARRKIYNILQSLFCEPRLGLSTLI